MRTVGLGRAAICQSIQKSHLTTFLIDERLHVLERNLWMHGVIVDQRCKVRCEEANAAEMPGQLVQDSIGNAEAIMCARAVDTESALPAASRGTAPPATELVQDDQRLWRGFHQNLSAILHLYSKSRLPGQHVVGSTHSRDNTVARRNTRRFGGHVATELRHDQADATHAKQCRLSGHLLHEDAISSVMVKETGGTHIGTGKKDHLALVASSELDIVWDEVDSSAEDAWVAKLLKFDKCFGALDNLGSNSRFAKSH